MLRTLIVSLAVALSAAPALAGDLIPTDSRFGPLRVKLHQVRTVIDNQVAITRVTQIFANDHDEQLEALYVFPTPADATIIDFTMTINGKVMRGELLERDRARATYEKIVARAKDPGLLEQIGKNVFRMRVFPILPKSEQKIELTYVERITYESGRCTWRYPLLLPDSKGGTKAESLDVAVEIASQIPIVELSSATNAFTFTRTGDRQAKAALMLAGADLSKDIEVVYRLARPKTGIDLVAHRTTGDGTFLLLVTPTDDPDAAPMPKDMTFVFDTSGSMEGTKMAQAKAALRFCVAKLKPQDRFNVIAFSDEVRAFRNEVVAAEAAELAAAGKFIDRLEAMGGTNIEAAMLRALQHRPAAGRPHAIVFLTDGRATVGETRPDEILRRVLAAGGESVRLFTFGVGEDVNRTLLADLADATRAITVSVAPKEDIEVAVGALQRRIGAPLITGLEIDWGGAAVEDVYPRKLTDLYAGVQLMVVGRYSKAGRHGVTLSGSSAGKRIEVKAEIELPEKREISDAIKFIWGARKVGDLLDRMRRVGVNDELKADIVRLSREYRVATPYTSFLVLENEAAYDLEGIDRKAGKYEEPGRFAKGDTDHNESSDCEDFDSCTNRPFVVSGLGGGGGSRYGMRLGGRQNIVVRGGGDKETEAAVKSALSWLARHQNKDGSWSPIDACKQEKCGDGKADGEATAAAVLVFLGAGFSHLSKEKDGGLCYGDVVRRGLQWIMSAQEPEGRIGPTEKAHLLSTLVLVEALGLTGSNLFRDQAQRALDFALSQWKENRSFGGVANARWAVLLLKAAEISGVVVTRAGFDQLRAWIDEAKEAQGGSLEVLMRVFGDKSRQAPRLPAAFAAIGARDPAKESDVESRMFDSLALFQLDGPNGTQWSAWNGKMKAAVVKGQDASKDACARGSWGGSAGATAMNALLLQVYYRYAHVFGSRK